ncbi:DUF4070 domain-containing protein [Scytonema sp. NUACC26]|uniref:DUF4070 domain-containing protein n=1 Tax=Scytonema sp. NUACC26 TaxID=3140176 RepID=UPI0034DC1024
MIWSLTRWQFWRNLWNMYRYNRCGLSSYLAVCAQIEHFVEYRQIVKREINEHLAQFLAESASKTEVEAEAVVA